MVLFASCRLDFFVYRYHCCDWPMQPCFNFRFFPGPAGLRVFSSSLPSLSLCFPLLSLASLFFLFCFPFFFSLSGWAVFVLPCGWYFGFSAALSWVGASARPVCFALFCCVISLCWGFGWPPVALARRVHVVLGICPPVSRQLLPAGIVGVGVLLGAVRGHGFPVWCGWVRL